MNIVYLGSGEFGVECLDSLVRSDHSIRFVVTQPAHPAGRGRQPKPTAAARWAGVNAIPFTETDNANSAEIIEEITRYAPDVILVIAFGQKVGAELMNVASKGAINVHASLLPKYRGAAPINWAIINGETETGISIITLAEKMDAGQILAQSQVGIEPDDTAGALHDKLAKAAAPLLIDTLDRIAAGTSVYTEQDHSQATFAPKLKKSDGFLDFSEPAELVERKIRGFWPWPGACANYVSRDTGKSVRVTIAGAEVVKLPIQPVVEPGSVFQLLDVVCGKNALKITKIKPAGSPLMNFKAFVNGRHTQIGDMFVRIDEYTL